MNNKTEQIMDEWAAEYNQFMREYRKKYNMPEPKKIDATVSASSSRSWSRMSDVQFDYKAAIGAVRSF